MRRYLALILVVLVACERPKPPQEFAADQAFAYLEQQVNFGPRIPGTAGHERMAQWLDSLLRQRADTLLVQQWVHVTARGDSLPLRNFIARFNPQAPERVLFLAHWDTRPRSDNASNKADSLKPVPGANDGASGVAVLLGMADALRNNPPRHGVDLLFVDGEDYGDFETEKNDVLIGSRYYAGHIPDGKLPLYAVLFDLVADKDLQIYQEGNSLLNAPDVVDLVWKTAAELGYGQYFIPQPKHTLTDDHVTLQNAGIRAIDVVDFDYGPNRAYWHTPQDTIDKVSAASLRIVGDVGMALIRNADR